MYKKDKHGNMQKSTLLQMATEDMRACDLDDEFDELFRDVEVENAGYAVKCDEKAPTARDGLVVATLEESDREANGGADSCHKLGPTIQHVDNVVYVIT